MPRHRLKWFGVKSNSEIEKLPTDLRTACQFAMNHTLSMPDEVFEDEQKQYFFCSMSNAVRNVWHYIQQQPNPALQDSLQQSFFLRLKEIEMDKPCALGCAQRILNTFEGIDFSLGIDEPNESVLRDEISAYAGALNNQMEATLFCELEVGSFDETEINDMKREIARSSIEARFVGFKRMRPEIVEKASEPVLKNFKHL